MKRRRSESMGNGLGIFEGYDPVIESMLLEWEVDRQRLPKKFLLPSVGEGQDEGERIVKAKSVNRLSTVKVRALRRRFTDAELKLWKHLRGRQIGGEKFRRQQPLGRYVVDFVCLERKLIVEVDGGQHAAPEYDKERTLWLELEGFRVIRFWNNEVLVDIGIVLDAVYKELSDDACHPHPGPLPSRERVKKPEAISWDSPNSYRMRARVP